MMKYIISIVIIIPIFIMIFYKEPTLIDQKTNLEWQDNTQLSKRNWDDANAYCSNLKLNGKSDWRLPTIYELQSVVDIQQYKPAVKNTFNNILPESYWSSTLYNEDFKHAWRIYFYDGRITTGDRRQNMYYTICVRK